MRFRSVLLVATTLSYPVAIYFTLATQGVRALAWPLLLLAILRGVIGREWLWGVLLLALAIVTFLTGQSVAAKFYPVVVSFGLLLLFGRSLLKPPSIVEKIARTRESRFPPEAVVYARKVTLLWCGFFVINGVTAASLALHGSDAAWALYSGGIAYICAGLLFAGEFVVRQFVRRKWQDV